MARDFSNKSWRIREALSTDAEGLESCMQSAYAAYQARMDGARLPPMDVDYSAEIREYPAWVVEQNGQVVGGLIMVFENHSASIANIAIDPACQGQGMGGALMDFAESRARENGFSALHLATHALLTENISLYRHLGWKESARDESRVFMHKDV